MRESTGEVVKFPVGVSVQKLKKLRLDPPADRVTTALADSGLLSGLIDRGLSAFAGCAT
jgi:hypothetical protein